MPRKAKTRQMVCKHFSWRLFCRDGVYYADGRSGAYNLGKQSLGTRDYEEALANLHRLDQVKAVELGLARPEPPQKGDRVGITEGWDAFLAHRGRAEVLGGVAATTLGRYRNISKNHLLFCTRHGIDAWNEIDKRTVERFGDWLTKELGHMPRTVFQEAKQVISVLRWLIDEKRLPESCAVRLRMRKPQGTDTYCYSVEQVTTMIDHCRTTPSLNWLGDVILTLACTGLRISELCTLRWSDIDFQSHTIRIADERGSAKKAPADIRRTKGRRSRQVPIHPTLLETLQRLPRADGSYVFLSPRGKRLRRGDVLKQFRKKVIEPLTERYPTPEGEVGFKDGTLRSLRHYFCSRCFLDGASEGEIRDWLGHQETKMVNHYRHLRSEDSQRKMRGMNFLSPPSDSSASGDH